MNNEEVKFFLATHMQHLASTVLDTLLDKRFYNNSQETGLVSSNCRQELLNVSSSALRNEFWALKGKF